MRFPARQRTVTELPGIRGTARVGRPTRTLIPRLKPGDIAVIDHQDLDRSTALALIEARVVAVVNRVAMVSGRFPNLGPQLLLDAGIVMVDQVGRDVWGSITDGRSLRLHDGELFADDPEPIGGGRVMDAELLSAELTAAATGMSNQLDSLSHNATAFLRLEQETLLHGDGVPTVATAIEGRPLMVVSADPSVEQQLRGARHFMREQHPVLVGVEAGADLLAKAGFTPDIVVTDPRQERGPSARVLKKARDVVVIVERGGSDSVAEPLERLGLQPRRFRTDAPAQDAALILADAYRARVIVTVGVPLSLGDFLDQSRSNLGSAWLTRLKVGARLVDVSAVSQLYSGQVRPRHLVGVLAAGSTALAAALATTPVGQRWGDHLIDRVSQFLSQLQGMF